MKYLIAFFPLALLAWNLAAQRQGSEKLYEKGRLNRNVVLRNATGINSPNLEFSPAFYENGIVYVSSRHKSGPVDKKIGETFFELFYAEFDADGMPSSPQNFSLNLNSQAHEGPVSFSRDWNTVYLSRNNMEKGVAKSNAKGKVVLKIYEARRGKYDWEGLRALSFNSDEFSCMHPALSADGKQLFFASDMPGGYGGLDLYYVEKKDGGWSRPINLGSIVNTKGDEVFPYLHESSTLFFSSNGHEGQGGLDIFMIDIGGNVWGKLKNLGSPFNSSKDDLGFIINEDGTRGYLASDRFGGTGKDDIYVFESSGTIIESDQESFQTLVVAYNELTNAPVSGANVRIFQRSADGFMEGEDLYHIQLLPSANNGELVMKLVRKNENELGAPKHVTDGKGEALCETKEGKNYLILVSKDGFHPAELQYSTLGETGSPVIRIPMKPNACTNLNGTVSVDGSDKKVPNALVRIINETTGAEELLRTNSNGEFVFCLPLGHDFAVFAEKEGFTKGVSTVSTIGTSNSQTIDIIVNLQPITGNFSKDPIRRGSVIVLENIYYDFNQHTIRKGAARELEALEQLMNLYPSMEIELTAHTDSRGTEEYNLDLSLKRAESAKRFLVQKGVAASRIKAFGMGKSQIRNRCVDGVECTDEEHQYNRRTEVKITRIDESVRVEYQEGNPNDRGRGK